MKVKDLEITDDFITVEGSESVLEVAKALAEEEIPDAVVLDENGAVLGTLDDFDIVSKVVAEGKDPSATTAADIMAAFQSLTLESTVEEAEQMMNDNEATILPVVDENNELIGVVTIMDILEALAKMNEPKGGIFSFLRGLF